MITVDLPVGDKRERDFRDHSSIPFPTLQRGEGRVSSTPNTRSTRPQFVCVQ